MKYTLQIIHFTDVYKYTKINIKLMSNNNYYWININIDILSIVEFLFQKLYKEM